MNIIINVGEECKSGTVAFNFQPETAYLAGTMTRYQLIGLQLGSRLLGIRFSQELLLNFTPINHLVSWLIRHTNLKERCLQN